MKPGAAAVMTAVAAVAVGTLAACASGGGAQSSSKPTSLTVLIVPSPSAAALEAVAPAYTRQTGVVIHFTRSPTTRTPRSWCSPAG